MNEFPLQPIDLVREPFRVLNTNNQSWKKNKNKSESGLSFRNKKKFQTINIENTEFYDVCYFHWSEFGEHGGHSPVRTSQLILLGHKLGLITDFMVQTDPLFDYQDCNHADFTLY